MHAAAEAVLAYQQESQDLVGLGVRRHGERLRQLVSVNTVTCGHKSAKIFRRSIAAVFSVSSVVITAGTL